eukprot:SAG31_NODE_14087_length_828_cov_0.938272_1_plen_57_part_10
MFTLRTQREYWNDPKAPHMIDGQYMVTGHVKGMKGSDIRATMMHEGVFVPVVGGVAK